MINEKEARGLIRFSAEDRAILKSVEEGIDRELAKAHTSDSLAGVPVRISLPISVSPKIAYELGRIYENSGGWQVTREIIQAQTTLIFIHPSIPMEEEIAKLAPLNQIPVSYPALPVEQNFRLLVRMPTRSRPTQALSVIEKYRRLAGCHITLEVIIDEDDASMMAPEVLQRLSALGCVITVGTHRSKVEACNGGRVKEWDIILLASDDMVPVVDGYGTRILEEFSKHWPNLDGAIHLDDGYAGDRLCTLPLMGRRFYDRFGYVYHPDYRSLYCDNEQTKVFSALGRLVYINEKLIEHRHFVTGAEKDSLYQKNEALGEKDRAIYRRRKDSGFFLNPLLSICIASLERRKPQLDRLLDHLYAQNLGLSIDVLVDTGSGSVGSKRQRLLERATGKYVCFVDDDDFVSHDYVDRIAHALASDPDCVSIRGAMTQNGTETVPFEHSLKYKKWDFNNGIYERSPNHLNPIRRELALKAGFPDTLRSEDMAYASALKPLLKTESDAGSETIYYYWCMPK